MKHGLKRILAALLAVMTLFGMAALESFTVGAVGLADAIPQNLTLHPRQTKTINGLGITSGILDWKSSDPSVVDVTVDGATLIVHAKKPGAANITTKMMGFTTMTIPVKVQYSIPQWFLVIFALGWLWI